MAYWQDRLRKMINNAQSGLFDKLRDEMAKQSPDLNVSTPIAFILSRQ